MTRPADDGVGSDSQKDASEQRIDLALARISIGVFLLALGVYHFLAERAESIGFILFATTYYGLPHLDRVIRSHLGRQRSDKPTEAPVRPKTLHVVTMLSVGAGCVWLGAEALAWGLLIAVGLVAGARMSRQRRLYVYGILAVVLGTILSFLVSPGPGQCIVATVMGVIYLADGLCTLFVIPSV